ncbi:hypothetical protein ACFWTE_04445 [Nocardiopsis sp. NPDC058631]|uniref:hypothetical protein n=1 Tax=Nocardiopsis sp. NPDC058631 TaxID=3346566 RepID=UPI00365A0A6D
MRERERNSDLARRVQRLEAGVRLWSRTVRALARRQRELEEEVSGLRRRGGRVGDQHRLLARDHDGVDSESLGSITITEERGRIVS